jgi:hypothetical protein
MTDNSIGLVFKFLFLIFFLAGKYIPSEDSIDVLLLDEFDDV